jgi:hypothetical protein
LVAVALETEGSRPGYREVVSSATTRLRGAAGHLGEDAEHLQHEVFDQLLRRTRRTPQEPERAPEEGERPAGESADTATATLPIDDYERLTAAQIVAKLPGLDDDQLTAVETFERAHATRITVLNTIRDLHETKPTP